VIPEQDLTFEQWEILLRSIAEMHQTSLDSIVFAHSYYARLKADFESKLQSTGALKNMFNYFEVELDFDSDDNYTDGLRELIYQCEQELLYELPSPLR
jgi:hypothetical protein